MNYIGLKKLFLSISAISLMIAFLYQPTIGFAQNEANKGWLEGTILTDKGKPATNRFSRRNGAKITIRPMNGGGGLYTLSEPERGGFYTFRGLEAGAYEVFVDESYQRDPFGRLLKYRPQRIFDVVIEPNKQTTLNITVNEGEGLEEIDKSAVFIEETDELARLQRENERLKMLLKECNRSI